MKIYLISGRMKDEVNKRNYLKVKDLAVGTDWPQGIFSLGLVWSLSQCLQVECLWSWGMGVAWREVGIGEGGQRQDLLGHASKGCSLMSGLPHFPFPCLSCVQNCPRRSSCPGLGFQLWAPFITSYFSCGLPGRQALRSLLLAPGADSELPE